MFIKKNKKTCYFAHLDSLSAENMISDMVRSEFPIRRFIFVPILHYIVALNSITKSTQNMILALKRRRYRLKTAIFIRRNQQVFTLKSLLERLKRDFNDSKSLFVSLKESYRFLISTCYFAHPSE